MAAPSSTHRFSWLQQYPLLGPLVGLVFVLVLFQGMIYYQSLQLEGEGRNFLTPYNIGLILTQTVIVATAALGMTLIIVSGGIDLSAGSVVALSGVVAGVILRDVRISFLAVVAAVLVGGAVGAVNGAIVARFNMMPFIVTLGMMGVARGVAKWIGNNQTVNYNYASTEGVNLLMNNPSQVAAEDVPGWVFGLLSSVMDKSPETGNLLTPLWLPPLGVVLLLVLTVFMSLVLNRSVLGRHIFALGSNEDTARLCGLRTRALKVAVYVIGGMFIGLAGVLSLSRLQQGDPTGAIGLELDIIAAVVIGGASLNGGVGSIWGAVLGALTMTALRSGTTNMGWPQYVQEIIIGAVIVLAVGLDKIRQRGLKG